MKALFIAILALLSVYTFADDGVSERFRGKIELPENTAFATQIVGRVEIRMPGQNEWQILRVGELAPLGATISTGFNSIAALELPHGSVTVRALTRITLEDLSRENTSIFVPVGRVRASVDRSESLSTDFRVRTAQSTAAVRGTEFETDGWSIIVMSGEVLFYNEAGEYRVVRQGESFTFEESSDFMPIIENTSPVLNLVIIRFRR